MERASPASAIRNAAWMVRYYHRNRLRRAQAIQRLGLEVREAFTKSDDYESMLTAIVDGLSPRDDRLF